eukprot:754036-Hanusia_phi.AAC.1
MVVRDPDGHEIHFMAHEDYFEAFRNEACFDMVMTTNDDGEKTRTRTRTRTRARTRTTTRRRRRRRRRSKAGSKEVKGAGPGRIWSEICDE